MGQLRLVLLPGSGGQLYAPKQLGILLAADLAGSLRL